MSLFRPFVKAAPACVNTSRLSLFSGLRALPAFRPLRGAALFSSQLSPPLAPSRLSSRPFSSSLSFLASSSSPSFSSSALSAVRGRWQPVGQLAAASLTVGGGVFSTSAWQKASCAQKQRSRSPTPAPPKGGTTGVGSDESTTRFVITQNAGTTLLEKVGMAMLSLVAGFGILTIPVFEYYRYKRWIESMRIDGRRLKFKASMREFVHMYVWNWMLSVSTFGLRFLLGTSARSIEVYVDSRIGWEDEDDDDKSEEGGVKEEEQGEVA
uniref:Transmembrane protein n=1 Tax=Palpitomonas bilix TaxID=652834 RepID=A0A7S3GHM2_9EUKA|mmetsp:Transcript_49940/g.128521  ORF Transcript_49940/g.128521 Transcript_49940/m.128521 type:complete len:267 (+) Transcript_49940:248-1048(+)|eukprot:CAMPEP_0113896580 /NCGR_PEP_ID=MMETSP0780_2-20120614/18120_1 /TAXON_ID=652834 /ORGANISM="Palpitomonas bilix" /LENGTH=266 /DNA_ID=CAMNT_0000887783 /DNA_START=223 /DNA_END=1023 /DNA_ORIENTATION=- /assembly_acc=CAM_ASM_000599